MNTPKNRALNGYQAAAEALRQAEPDFLLIADKPAQDSLGYYLKEMELKKILPGKLLTVAAPVSRLELACDLALTGARVSVAATAAEFTAAQSLLSAIAVLHLPLVVNVTGSMSPPPFFPVPQEEFLSAVSSNGWLEFLPATAQEVYDANLLSWRLAGDKDVRLPALLYQEEVFLGHWVEGVKLLADEAVGRFLGLREKSKIDFGEYRRETAEKLMRLRRNANIRALEKYRHCEQELSGFTNRALPPAEVTPEAKAGLLLVTTGSSKGPGFLAVNAFNQTAPVKAAQLHLRLYRPFPGALIKNLCVMAKAIGIVEASLAPGANSQLFGDFAGLFCPNPEVKIKSFLAGQSGRGVTAGELGEILKSLDL